MKKKVKPRVIGEFWEDTLFKCELCGEKFKPENVALVANAWFDGSIVSFEIWCEDCFDENTEGDMKAWNSSPLIVCGEQRNV